MIYFTSDLHLGHSSIISMQNRPFDNAEDMDTQLIKNINELVQPNDKLYILGDVTHHLSGEEANELIRQIQCRKFLIFGNHDMIQNPETCLYDLSLFEWSGYYLKMNAYGHNFILMHYPLLSWDRSRRGSIMLHGHIHSEKSYNEKNIENGIRRFDVGVDANDYRPVSIKQVILWGDETRKNRSNVDDADSFLPGSHHVSHQ